MIMKRILAGLILLHAVSLLCAQRVGINTITPQAPIHIIADSSTNSPFAGRAISIWESHADAYLQLSTRSNPAGLFSGNESTAVRSGIRFPVDSSVHFLSGGLITPGMVLSKQGRLGINTETPKARLHVSDSSVLFTAFYPHGNEMAEAPQTGIGSRMMWYAERSAFRAGVVSGQHWDRVLTGLYSMAMGFNATAKGTASVALGISPYAEGNYSTAIGTASYTPGESTLALGSELWVRAYRSVAVGAFNDTTGSSLTTWVPTDPIFAVGNGTTPNNRHNALTVLKNGRTGLNTLTPQSVLHVLRNNPSGGPFIASAIATFESSDQAYLHLSQPNNAQSGLLSGNGVTSIRSGLVFGIDSSLHFRTGGNVTNMKLDKDGWLGLKTSTPKAIFHIRRSGVNNATFNPYAISIFESGAHGYLQLIQNANMEAGILSSTSTSDMRSGIIFLPDSSVNIRAGGNINRLVISKDGKLGVNTNVPESNLHVMASPVNGNVVLPNTVAVFENNNHGFIGFITPNDKDCGFYAGSESTSLKNQILFKANNSIQLGFNAALTITQNDRVGINTTTPVAKLDVQGDIRLGFNGTVLSAIMQHSINYNLPAISGGTSYTATIPISGVNLGGTVHVSPSGALPDGLLIAYAKTNNDSVDIKFTNVTAGVLNPGDIIYHITVIQ